MFRAGLAAKDGTPLKVSEVMTRDPITISPRDSVTEAAEIMIENKIGCLPVVDDHGRVVGILTEGDFVALMASHDLRQKARSTM